MLFGSGRAGSVVRIVGTHVGATLVLAITVDDRWEVFAAEVVRWTACQCGEWCRGIGGVERILALINAKIVDVGSTAALVLPIRSSHPVLDAVANNHNRNLLRCSRSGGGAWSSGGDLSIDTLFTDPEVWLVGTACVELEIVYGDGVAMALAGQNHVVVLLLLLRGWSWGMLVVMWGASLEWRRGGRDLVLMGIGGFLAMRVLVALFCLLVID